MKHNQYHCLLLALSHPVLPVPQAQMIIVPVTHQAKIQNLREVDQKAKKDNGVEAERKIQRKEPNH